MIKYPNGGHVPDAKLIGDKDEEEMVVHGERLQSKRVLACVIVHGEPVQAGRPRFNSKTRKAHDPEKSREYKAMVKESAALQYHGPLIADKAIAVDINIYRSIQKSASHKEHSLRAAGEHRPIVKPDTSNYVKLIEDALTGVIWEDDNLIVSLVAKKYYSDDPRIEVTVTEA